MSAAQVFPAGNLPAGAFLTTLGGRRCTAVPRPVPTTSSESLAAVSVAAVPAAPPAAATTSIGAFVAAENVNANTVLAETNSFSPSAAATSTTSSSLAIITANTIASPELEVAEVSQVEEVVEPVPPAALAATAPPAALPSTPGPVLPTFSVITSAQQREPIVPSETSQTDSSVTAAAPDVGANNPPAAFPDGVVPSAAPTLDPVFTDVAAAPTGGAAPEATNTGTTTNSAVSVIPSPNSGSVQSTVAVAGGVIGGVVALSIAAFLIWWWRRRVIKKRRSTLLTPLDAANYRDEKGSYEINRGSIGPTPMGEKFRAAVGYNMKKIRGRMSQLVSRNGAPSVNLDRGTSQFMEVNNHSRATSSAMSDRGEVTTKDRFADWWSRLTFNWKREKRLSKDTLSIGGGNLTSSNLREKQPPGRQPDFLTLLNMDDGELDREAQRRRASISRKNGSAGSADQFLGKLNLSFANDDPFSDANALAHQSAKPAPLVVSQSNNPFSDANAIRDPPAAALAKQPSTYVADMRRSRGQSVSAGTNRQPSTLYGRGSGGSIDDFADRRNKFRSDPFDLERPELLAGARAAKNSITSSTAGTAGSERSSRMALSGGVTVGPGGQIRRPTGAHRRGDSFTSKYSSGISMGDWSDPGPDVGPAASRWDGPEPRASPTQGWRDRLEREAASKGGGDRQSGGSQGSVGKAM